MPFPSSPHWTPTTTTLDMGHSLTKIPVFAPARTHETAIPSARASDSGSVRMRTQHTVYRASASASTEIPDSTPKKHDIKGTSSGLFSPNAIGAGDAPPCGTGTTIREDSGSRKNQAADAAQEGTSDAPISAPRERSLRRLPSAGRSAPWPGDGPLRTSLPASVAPYGSTSPAEERARHPA